jgi:hypothetical protein
MELKFEELDNSDSVNYINYWSNANPTANESSNTKKPKVSYDDILSSLNMVVNNGVLQFAKPTPQSQLKQEQSKPQQKKQVIIREQSNIHHQQQQTQQNNYITNKYFKDYQEKPQEQIIEEPLTKEQYRQMVIQDYINRQQAQRRIAQIKSKKLLFNTHNINIAPNQMPRDMNKLFSTFSTFKKVHF